MKKFLHPSYAIIIIELFIFLFLVDVALTLTSFFPILMNMAYWIPVGIILGISFIYLIYSIIDFSHRSLMDMGGYRKFLARVHKEKRFRRMATSYLGSFLNLAMTIAYFAYGYVTDTLFYLIAAQYLFIGFIGRVYLLYNAFYKRHDKELHGFRLSSWLTLFMGMAMQGITFAYTISDITIRKSLVMTIGIGIYAIIKIISAFSSLKASFKNKDLTLLSFCLISMSLAFYSLFMLIITVPDAPNRVDVSRPEHTYVGFIFASVMMVIALLCLIYYHKIKKGIALIDKGKIPFEEETPTNNEVEEEEKGEAKENDP